MLYFFILSAFAVAVLVMGVVVMGTRYVEPLRPIYPFAWRVLLWSSLGFLSANGLWLLLVSQVSASSGAGAVATMSTVVKIGYAVLLVFGPVMLSVAGFVGGAVLGLVLAFFASRRNAARGEEPFGW